MKLEKKVSEISKCRKSEVGNFGKDERRNFRKIRLIVFGDPEYGMEILQKTWNGTLVIWDH